MDLNWFESVLYGLLSGLTEILPVSAQAHKTLMLKFFGIKANMELMDLSIHLAVFAALYFSSQSQLIRFSRAKALARVPKRKRRRPLDTRSLMDISMLRTMLIPVVIGLLLYQYTQDLNTNLLVLSVFVFLNGLILYIPQFLPSSNRDSRTLSPIEGLLMGLGGAVSILPGISSVGASTSIGSVCGVERSYCLNMALIMHMGITLGMIVYDMIALIAVGLGGLTFLMFLRYLLTALLTFGSTLLGIKLMRYLAANRGFGLFSFYCFGQALFTFILNLMA